MISINLPPTTPAYTETRPKIEFSETREENKEGTIQFGYAFENNKTKEQLQTDFNFTKVKKEDENNTTNKYAKIDDGVKFVSGFSENYIAYNSEKMVRGILDKLTYWLENGTQSSYHIIASIRDSVNHYSTYLTQKEENRLFLNGIKLLLDNNDWENLNDKKLKNLIFEVKRFEDGNIDWDKVELFSKQIKRMKLNILKEDGEKESKEKE